MDDTTGTPSFTAEELAFIESIFQMARSGHTDELASVIDGGVPVNLTNAKGDSLLMLAAYHQHEQTVAMLIDRGADTARINDMGQTAISCAVFRNNPPIVHALLDAGADPDLGNHTALEIARQFDITEMVALLGERAQGEGAGEEQ